MSDVSSKLRRHRFCENAFCALVTVCCLLILPVHTLAWIFMGAMMLFACVLKVRLDALTDRERDIRWRVERHITEATYANAPAGWLVFVMVFGLVGLPMAPLVWLVSSLAGMTSADGPGLLRDAGLSDAEVAAAIATVAPKPTRAG